MAKGVKARRSRGTALILYTVLLPTLLLFVGLAIDLSILYVVQTRLSSAVDGAALGAGRLLGTSANTNEIAGGTAADFHDCLARSCVQLLDQPVAAKKIIFARKIVDMPLMAIDFVHQRRVIHAIPIGEGVQETCRLA